MPPNVTPSRPNVLIFCVDEMRADHMGCAGNDVVQTPNLDRLAARGVLFRRSYCNNPICMPARATMFTGLLPRDHGVRVNGQALRTDLPTLPGVLAEHGYRTHAAGKLHLTPWVPMLDEAAGVEGVPDADGVGFATPAELDRCPEAMQAWRTGTIDAFPTPYYGLQSVDFVGGHVSYVYGNYAAWLRERGGDPALLTPEQALVPPSGAPQTYKAAIPVELHYNRYIADSTISVIQQAARDRRPFFAWCSFPDPHMPIAPPAPYCDLYDPADVALPVRREGEVDDLPPYYARILSGELHPNGVDNTGVTDDHWREMMALTYGMITHVDTEVGRVLDALAAAGLTEETLIVFLGDHGDMMGDHGLLWKGPYTFQGCINIPTMVAPPAYGEGARGRVSDALIAQVDLLPSVLEACGVPMPGAAWRDRATPFERGSLRDLALFPGRSWLPMVRGAASASRESVVIENDDPTTGYRVRCLVTDRYRLTIYPGTSHGELFDLRDDPDELHNLWYQDHVRALRLDLVAELLDAYALETPLYPIPVWNS